MIASLLQVIRNSLVMHNKFIIIYSISRSKYCLILFVARDRDDDRKDRYKDSKDEKDGKLKSVFEEFNISRPTLQLSPFTGLSLLFCLHY